jgi:hypothetical protein
VNKDGFFYKLKAKSKQDPMVPLGMLLTTGVLGGGLYSMVLGTSPHLSQKFMRMRIVAQAATVVMLCTGGIMMGNLSLENQPKKETYEEMLLAQLAERRLEDNNRAARVAALTEKPKA